MYPEYKETDTGSFPRIGGGGRLSFINQYVSETPEKSTEKNSRKIA